MKKQIACPVCEGKGFVAWINKTEDTCSAGSKMCPHCDGTGLRWVDMTNADRIRGMSDQELAIFLEYLAYVGTEPWCVPFEKKFCQNCPTVEGTIKETGQTMDFHECDFADGKCPHGSDISWWLQQPAEERVHGQYVYGDYINSTAVVNVVKEDN